MGALVKLAAYLAPKALDLVKECASTIWETITDNAL